MAKVAFSMAAAAATVLAARHGGPYAVVTLVAGALAMVMLFSGRATPAPVVLRRRRS